MDFLKNSQRVFGVASHLEAVSDRDDLSHYNGFPRAKMSPSCNMSRTWTLSQPAAD
jgi:hypothetical protein